MSASFGGGAFPGMPAAAAPGAQPQQQPAGSGFVLIIPPDMDWQPIDSTDVLEKDGYYMARIKTEKAQTGEKENHGVWLTLELVTQRCQQAAVQVHGGPAGHEG